MSGPRLALRSGVALMCVALSACAVGPNFHTPAAPSETAYTPQPINGTGAAGTAIAGNAQTLVPGGKLAANWWRQFNSPALDALIDRALAANSDLAAAQAAVKVARETWLAQRGVLFPQIDASANTSRNRSSQYLSPVTSGPASVYSLQTAQVSVGYTIDLFGGNRRQVEQVRAQYDAQRFQTEAARITLIDNVAAAAFQEASLRGQVAAQQRIIDIETRTLDILHRQLRLGEIAGADVLTQDAALAQARAALPPLQKSLAQQQDLLAYLTGRSPADGVVEGVDLATLNLPGELPLSLPAELVRQRPDIRAAEENLHAASAAVGVAIAARLPNITLSAAAGGLSGGWSTLLASSNSFWSIGAGVTQPIFQGGTLLHKQRAAQAALQQAQAQYRSAVLTAFQNVADTLHALQLDADALAAAQAASHSAEASLAVSQRQYARGQVAFVNVLTAEQALRQADQMLVQAEAGRFADTAALYQALGGDWH